MWWLVTATSTAPAPFHSTCRGVLRREQLRWVGEVRLVHGGRTSNRGGLQSVTRLAHIHSHESPDEGFLASAVPFFTCNTPSVELNNARKHLYEKKKPATVQFKLSCSTTACNTPQNRRVVAENLLRRVRCLGVGHHRMKPLRPCLKIVIRPV